MTLLKENIGQKIQYIGIVGRESKSTVTGKLWISLKQRKAPQKSVSTQIIGEIFVDHKIEKKIIP